MWRCSTPGPSASAVTRATWPSTISSWRRGKFLYLHGADDNHNHKPFGDLLCDSFGAWTQVLAKDLSYASVIEALEKGWFYASTGPTITNLTFAGGHVTLDCTPAQRIIAHSSPKKTWNVYQPRRLAPDPRRVRPARGDPLRLFLGAHRRRQGCPYPRLPARGVPQIRTDPKGDFLPMRHTAKRSLCAVGLAAALLLAGCGGSTPRAARFFGCGFLRPGCARRPENDVLPDGDRARRDLP